MEIQTIHSLTEPEAIDRNLLKSFFVEAEPSAIFKTIEIAALLSCEVKLNFSSEGNSLVIR